MSRLTHVKVKFACDKYITVIPIKDMVDFDQETFDKNGFDTTKLYKAWWKDEKNIEGIKLGVQIGGVARGDKEFQALSKSRDSFPELHVSELERYSDEESSSSQISESIEKNKRKLRVKKIEVVNEAMNKKLFEKYKKENSINNRKRLIDSDVSMDEDADEDHFTISHTALDLSDSVKMTALNDKESSKSSDALFSPVTKKRCSRRLSYDSESSVEGIIANNNSSVSPTTVGKNSQILNLTAKNGNPTATSKNNDSLSKNDSEKKTYNNPSMNSMFLKENNSLAELLAEWESEHPTVSNLNKDKDRNLGKPATEIVPPPEEQNGMDGVQQTREHQNILDDQVPPPEEQNGMGGVQQTREHQNILDDQVPRGQEPFEIAEEQQVRQNQNILHDPVPPGQDPFAIHDEQQVRQVQNILGAPVPPGQEHNNFVQYAYNVVLPEIEPVLRPRHRIENPLEVDLSNPILVPEEGGINVDSAGKNIYDLFELDDVEQIYLGEGKAVTHQLWRYLKSHRTPYNLARNLAQILWGKPVLMNRSFKPSKLKIKVLPGRSPRKQLTPRKYNVLRKLYVDFIDGKPAYRANKDIYLKNLNKHVGDKIKDIRNQTFERAGRNN
ncbi:hypothetical protein TKK_0010222 [Trichogramma kaykai]|uniref:BEN domain-containing protein n=1 Tax=Trichogramma kaykai TaxID=54128 RepID=A0ABD2WYR0_9HYME